MLVVYGWVILLFIIVFLSICMSIGLNEGWGFFTVLFSVFLFYAAIVFSVYTNTEYSYEISSSIVPAENITRTSNGILVVPYGDSILTSDIARFYNADDTTIKIEVRRGKNMFGYEKVIGSNIVIEKK
jgi:hypothetical protein